MKTDKIICQKCRTQILVIPDLKAMTKAINTHVRLHVEEMEKNNVPYVQILRSRTEIESALIEEILKEINYQNVLTPQENSKTIRKTAVRYPRYGKLKMQKNT